MKAFASMYLLIGIAHGAGTLGAQQHELEWWEPPAIILVVGVLWPMAMANQVQETVEKRKAAKAA